jgi:EmrB/QacA subfamily drug resistance transporter
VLRALSGLLVGNFLSMLAATIVSPVLPTMIGDLGAGETSYAWVVGAELLALTVSVPLWGKLADLKDQKRLVQVASGIFLIGSLLAGSAGTAQFLIASRLLQGVGAGGMSVLVPVVMASLISPREQGRYSGIQSAVFAAAMVSGPLLGGLIVTVPGLSWRWCFWINVPVGLVSMALVQATLRVPPRPTRGSVDYFGAAFIVGGLTSMSAWISMLGREIRPISIASLVLLATTVTCLVLAFVVESRSAEPFLPVRLLRNRTLALGTLASTFVGVVLTGATVFLSQYLQVSRGLKPLHSGLMTLPVILGLLIASSVGGWRVATTGRWKRYLVLGGALLALAVAGLGALGPSTPLGLMAVLVFVLGLAIGLFMQNVGLAIQNDVPASQIGMALSLSAFFRSFGGVAGVSAFGAFYSHRIGVLLARGLSKAGLSPHAATADKLPSPGSLPPQVLQIVRHSYGTAIGNVFLMAAPFALLAFIAVCRIRETPLHTTTTAERLLAESGVSVDVA